MHKPLHLDETIRLETVSTGYLPEAEVAAVRVQTTWEHDGPVTEGKVADDIGYGLIPARILSGLKARLLLGLTLRHECGQARAAALPENRNSQDNQAMADFLVIAYPSEAQAEEVRSRLLGMQQEYLLELGDAVVAVKQPNGAVKLNQIFSPATAGAASGALWGTLLGLILLSPLIGAAIGAAGGALGGKLSDVGINDNFMREVAQSLESGHAALFLLIRKMTADKVLTELQDSGGRIMRSSFDETKEAVVPAA